MQIRKRLVSLSHPRMISTSTSSGLRKTSRRPLSARLYAHENVSDEFHERSRLNEYRPPFNTSNSELAESKSLGEQVFGGRTPQFDRNTAKHPLCLCAMFSRVFNILLLLLSVANGWRVRSPPARPIEGKLKTTITEFGLLTFRSRNRLWIPRAETASVLALHIQRLLEMRFILERTWAMHENWPSGKLGGEKTRTELGDASEVRGSRFRRHAKPRLPQKCTIGAAKKIGSRPHLARLGSRTSTAEREIWRYLFERADRVPALGHPGDEGGRRRRVVVFPRLVDELADAYERRHPGGRASPQALVPWTRTRDGGTAEGCERFACRDGRQLSRATYLFWPLSQAAYATERARDPATHTEHDAPPRTTAAFKTRSAPSLSSLSRVSPPSFDVVVHSYTVLFINVSITIGVKVYI